ncbi:MAG: ABC transporter permease subunit, partial [Halobacteria archaeon]|nr:ABC transporter permease subunit [Halobacteria archaeon]
MVDIMDVMDVIDTIDTEHGLKIAEREYRTVLRTPVFLALGLGYSLIVVGIAWISGFNSYTAVVLDLLKPLELLVPVLAFAFGYKSVSNDTESGESEIIHTYPVSSASYILGIFLGRLAVVLSVIILPLLAVGLLTVGFGGVENPVLATHSGGDSVFILLRFVFNVALYTVAVLSAVTCVSAFTNRTRSSFALGATLV